MSDDFAFGNIVRSARARGWLYDLGMGAGLAITGLNAWYAYLITQEAATYPLWLGGAAAVYAVVAPGLFGVSKANTPVGR
jgi:hypothetical protein